MTEDDRAKEIALAEYTEVVTQFRALTEIRFKLLTFLPLGTVAAAFFANKDVAKQPAIPLFALVVTLCIAAYNKRNDQFYDELVSRAAELERELQIEHGSFANRPKPWLRYGFQLWRKYVFVDIQHRWPIGLIYAASASLWAYVFTEALLKDHLGSIWSTGLKVTAAAVVIACWQGLRSMERAHANEQKEAVTSLMGLLLFGSNDGSSQGKFVEAIIAAEKILDVDEDKAKRRVAYHWKAYEQKRDPRAASALLSAVIDLPARWIEDVWTGRR